MRPAEAFRCQSLAKEIAAELRAKYDLKAACLPVNVCLLRSSIMIATLAIAPTLRARFSRAMVLLAIMLDEAKLLMGSPTL